ncbi:indolepyruvate oxidoreductase subunit beta [Halorhodospira halophila]|uniref:Pyruvate ferredoxin/flavodoxin oxidoreductase n=1 Tax=Halorhodospira halophila (strain DSM 244 / SL1) TaxID=349124 RepID=A1WT52_HALHL|nr:indolepyruvate oxidoreductase subunit beta [Halorhodospira halophila]ABM60864.1 pyruvate ferredoxin/flavodoxin oxidoreductase [Halorhodospira halophila SL1]MBK1728519.1 pyruvate ferredoxin oxidoreductase [Halorhodospira halophila]
MSDRHGVTNIVIAGLGGQGIVTGSDILAHAAFAAGHDVKKSEIHGMSQRGGSVSSDIRFGPRVHSPMVPHAEADFLIISESSQVLPNRHRLGPQGRLITPDAVPQLFQDESSQQAARMVNVALLGVLSAHLDIAEAHWIDAIRTQLPEKLHEMNLRAFRQARGIEALFGTLTGDSRPRPTL